MCPSLNTFFYSFGHKQATNAEDGTSCVWCSLASLGFCVTEDQADIIKKQIPGLVCDNDGNDDDSVPNDDDTAPNDDDSVPDDYWTCLKDHKTEKDCESDGCAWCVSFLSIGKANVRRLKLSCRSIEENPVSKGFAHHSSQFFVLNWLSR